MPTQVDVNGAIVEQLPAAGSSGFTDYGDISPDVVTIRSGFDWSFWALVALLTWWALDGRKSRRAR